ncbi:toxin regulator [Domibacillus sp. 8LH]|uniref:toxin regulator n=1 Tax=Domibacillus sp. 8LH TaxID=3073900 RepID=UPI00317CA267
MDWKNKKVMVLLGAFILVTILLVTNLSSVSEKEDQVAALQLKLDESEKTIKDQDTKITTLEQKVEEAQPWFELTEKEQQQKVEEQKAKDAAKKAVEEAAAKKKAETEAAAAAEAQRKAEEEEKRGYETGITYDQLARTPDDYIGEKVKFYGKVVQVMEGDGEVQVRIAVNEDYDTILFGAYDSYITNSRILEDDLITVMGTSNGLLTYESTMGGDITIPSIFIDKIEQ